MSDHGAFIVAAYAVSLAVVGLTVARIVLRHRALRRALARFGEAEARRG